MVLCAPIGHEYVRSYRTLLHLADQLTEAGLVALRFDYAGCGSSAGDPAQLALVDTWTDDIIEAAVLIERMTGSPASLVGLRLGATLAARAASRHEIECLVAWAPVVSGARYVRDQRVLAKFGGSAPDSHAGLIEGGGFPLSHETAADLGSIDMRKLPYRIRGRALVLERDYDRGCPELPGRLRSQGVETEVARVGGYLAMMNKPHLGVVPEEVVDRIAGWLGARVRSAPASTSRPAPERPVARDIDTSVGMALDTSVAMDMEQASVTEELLHVPGSPPLFGVLTTPGSGPIGAHPLLLLTNGGSTHSVGPNRLHVEIARTSAVAGFSTLRIDLGTLGDSIRGRPPEENHPFPSTALADLSRVIEWLSTERDVHRVVLGGLCSGAYHAFRAGVELPHPELVGVLPINPLTFRWARPASPDEWEDAFGYAAVDDPSKWSKLMKGEYDVHQLVSFAARAAWTRSTATVVHVLDRFRLVPPRALDRELLRCVEAGRRVDFVCARYDRGYGLLRSSAGRITRRLERAGVISMSVVEGADHSFSKRAWRAELARLIIECLGAYGQTRSRSLESTLGHDAARSPFGRARARLLPGLDAAR